MSCESSISVSSSGHAATEQQLQQPVTTAFATATKQPPREDAVVFLRRVLANKTTLPESYVVIIQEFLQRIQQLQQPMTKTHSHFEHEYRTLCASIDRAPWYEAALTPQTKHTLAKNRYRDVLPFENTRVKINNPLQQPAGDYINANFVDDTYIACCAPIPTAIVDFWQMLWQKDVFVVLMLTNFVERERIKADLYWDPRGKTVEFGGVFVQLIGEEQHPAVSTASSSQGFIVRKFKMWTTVTMATPRVLLHVQLTTWPDHGVLRDFRVVAPMLELVNSYRDSAQASTGRPARVVVHCSAGIGRSGTFIAIDVILQQLHGAFAAAASGHIHEGERMLRQALDVRAIVHRLRMQRPGMVQTGEQYEMIFRYVAAVLTNQQPW